MSKPSGKQPLKTKSDNPSLNSEMHAATSNQSVVTPEDYPADERAQQTALVGKKRTKRAAP